MMGPFARSLSILIYHRVLPRSDPLLPDLVCAAEFERQMAALARCFRVMPLPEAIRRVRAGELPARAACVTFDDGYADNHDVALPILLRQGVPATFFIATGFLDGGRMWNDDVIDTLRLAPGPRLEARAAGLEPMDIASLELRRRGIECVIGALKYLPMKERRERVDRLAADNGVRLPPGAMMSTAQTKTLHDAGMTIGAHTVNHPILAQLDPASAAEEIRASKSKLEAVVGRPVTLFAYPNGKPRQDYLAAHVDMVRTLGFEAAVTTAWGVSRHDSDPYQLPRFTPWDRGLSKFIVRLLGNTFRPAADLV